MDKLSDHYSLSDKKVLLLRIYLNRRTTVLFLFVHEIGLILACNLPYIDETENRFLILHPVMISGVPSSGISEIFLCNRFIINISALWSAIPSRSLISPLNYLLIFTLIGCNGNNISPAPGSHPGSLVEKKRQFLGGNSGVCRTWNRLRLKARPIIG